jgi:hypothetical protein
MRRCENRPMMALFRGTGTYWQFSRRLAADLTLMIGGRNHKA